ncbi:hypothetical protein GOP47_0022538 [Adiantum capillus-veneris]|uniref:SHSP domain-containing protein n=1 Tax=Adiantum capillus-veneris TaxID=13818 RepID=A0A9D4U5J2_ADICA|nr:hypothetical protein GOP47_0022538 [Adiantum capillus-veneris]
MQKPTAMPNFEIDYVKETAHAYIINCKLTGVFKEKVQVQAEVDSNCVVVKCGHFFARRIHLPSNSSSSRTTASWDGRFLTLFVPRTLACSNTTPSKVLIVQTVHH